MNRCLVLALSLPLGACAYFGDAEEVHDIGVLDDEVADAFRGDDVDLSVTDALDGDFSLVAALPDGTREVRVYTGTWELDSALQTNLAWAHRAAVGDGFTIVLGGGEMTKLLDDGSESAFPPEGELPIDGPLAIAVTGGGVQIGGEPEYTETTPGGATSQSGSYDGSCWMDVTGGAQGEAIYLDMIDSEIAVNPLDSDQLVRVADLPESRLDHVARAADGTLWLANTFAMRMVAWTAEEGSARVVDLSDVNRDWNYIRSLAPAGDGGALALVHDDLESHVVHVAPDGAVQTLLSSGAEIWYDLKPVL